MRSRFEIGSLWEWKCPWGHENPFWIEVIEKPAESCDKIDEEDWVYFRRLDDNKWCATTIYSASHWPIEPAPKRAST